MTETIPITVRQGFEVVGAYRFDIGSSIAFGRSPDVDLILDDFEVSRRHGIIALNTDTATVTDLSQNGIYLDGEAINGVVQVDYGTPLRIGPFTVNVGMQTQSQGERKKDFRRDVLVRLVESLDLKVVEKQSDDLRRRVEAALERIVRQMGPPDGTDVATLVRDLSDEALGLGPLERLLADDDVSEIMVVNPFTIFAERKGRLQKTDLTFSSEKSVRTVIDRIIAPLGRRIDELSPMVDARLPDGSRVNAVIPPLAIHGSCITIRKFAKTPLVMADLIRFGSMTEEMATVLEKSVAHRANIVISGGTGSGKTTLLGVLSSAIPESERIVTIEDAAELRLLQEHVVSLESRPANAEGKGRVAIRDLVRNALRMRPDRIVVGECRGGEALDMLQAMNTGHDGSLTTLHANSPAEALSRLETLCLMSGVDLPSRAIRDQIAGAVDIIVQQSRLADGSRKVTSITEVEGIEEDGVIRLSEVYRYVDKPGKRGGFIATGRLPRFASEADEKEAIA